MFLIVTTKNPKQLLLAIKKKIITETIPSWSIAIGDKIVYLTLTDHSSQSTAFISSHIIDSSLTFSFADNIDIDFNEETKQVYYKRFADMLRNNFNQKHINIQRA